MADLNSLLIFAKVVEANSFSRAASNLKMPTSTVSRRIAELEAELGVRLLERSTRNLRLTNVGADILAYAQNSAELSESVDSIVSNHLADVSGLLKVSAPPSLSDTMLVPIITAFQETYPNVRIDVFVTERFVDLIAERVDVILAIDVPKDASLVKRRILHYRHQLVASPAYLNRHKPPESPEDLADHRLLAFSHGESEMEWHFQRPSNAERRKVTFRPALAMNDFAGIAAALLRGAGICDFPPVVQPRLLREGLLVEVMPEWHLNGRDLTLVHLGNRFIPRPVRVFNDFVLQAAPKLFPLLPS